MPNGNTAIESRRFEVELEVEGVSTEQARGGASAAQRLG